MDRISQQGAPFCCRQAQHPDVKVSSRFLVFLTRKGVLVCQGDELGGWVWGYRDQEVVDAFRVIWMWIDARDSHS